MTVGRFLLSANSKAVIEGERDGLVKVVSQALREAALDDLTSRARAGRLTLDDIQGGTFTITNPGVFGSIWLMMHLGLSFDHRIFDGAASMRFLNALKGWFAGFQDGR